MADSRKKPSEERDNRDLYEAEAELRWMFGGGPSSREGDRGVCSVLGKQLDAMQAGLSASKAIDLDSAERKIAQGFDANAKEAIVEAALAKIGDQRDVLEEAFDSDGDMRPGVSQVVVRTNDAKRAAAVALGRVATQTEVRQHVLEADISAPWLVRAKASAELLVTAALRAYADARAHMGVPRRPHMPWENR